LEGAADGREGVGRRVVGWEDRDVEGIVLVFASVSVLFLFCFMYFPTSLGRVRLLTLRLITPKQAIEGIAVAMIRFGGCLCGRFGQSNESSRLELAYQAIVTNQTLPHHPPLPPRLAHK
jgi:hypothetical protein